MSRPIMGEPESGTYLCPLCDKSPCKHSVGQADGYTHREVIGGEVKLHIDPEILRKAEARRKALPSITDEARRLVRGERADAYGPADESFRAIGRMWGALLGTGDIEPRKVALMMAALKLHRESHKASRENRVDLVGYALLADQLVAEGDEHV